MYTKMLMQRCPLYYMFLTKRKNMCADSLEARAGRTAVFRLSGAGFYFGAQGLFCVRLLSERT